MQAAYSARVDIQAAIQRPQGRVRDGRSARAFSLRIRAQSRENHCVTECYRCWAEVDLNALRQNLAQIRNLAGPTRRIVTVVKADAYGHGLRQIAAVLMQSGTEVFGVANLAEARAIRTVGRGWPILMLGACLPQEIDLAVREDVMPTISNLEEARHFAAAGAHQRKRVCVHVKVDTGMGRLGTAPAEVVSLVKAIAGMPELKLTGLFTHYSSAEDDAEFTCQQRQAFRAAVQAVVEAGHEPEWRHASNSGGLLLEPGDEGNTVRAGLLVYGIVPQGQRALNPTRLHGFRPALSWKSRVTLVRDVPRNTPISYGHTYRTQKTSRLATIAVGYADGLPRAASNRAYVLIRGQRCPIVGRVTMDQTVIDVTEVENVQPADEVQLIGEQAGVQITAADLAVWCDTIPWEVLTNISYRVPRVYRGSHAA